MARGHFNPDINPRLLKLIEGFKYDKYGVNPTSGYRPGDPRQHGRGQAIDIQLTDPKGGALANYQDPSTFAAYQQYANALYQHALQTDPELAKQLRWGGYFSGGKGKYGALDLMHFDTAGETIPMAGGSWEGGLTPEQAQIWGLQAGGGLGGGAGTDTAVGSAGADTLDPHQQWISSMWKYAQDVSAKTGVDPRLVMAQSALETGYGKSAPNNAYFGVKGKGSGQKTLEFINGKMTPVQADFRAYANPEESFQDYGNLLMGSRYAGVRGAKGLEAQIAEMGKSGYATDPDYASKLLAIAQKMPEGGYGSGASSAPADTTGGAAGGTTAGDGKAKPPEKKKSWWENMLSGLGEGAAGIAGATAQTPSAGLPAPPSAVVAAPDPVSMFDQQAAEIKRQRLAEAMARLNSGKIA